MNELRIWWISNPPRESFTKKVNSVDEAKKYLALLAEYDLYLDDLIESNVSGLEEYVDDEWSEWYDEVTDDDIWGVMDE